MPISTSYQPISYAGDGVTNAFPITFPYQLQTDIVVKSTVLATNTVTTLTLGTDYTVAPTTNSPANTGTVVTTAVPVAGVEITLSRNVPTTQLTTWVPNDPNLSTSTMNAVDKLTMIAQQNEAEPFDLGGTAATFLRGDNALSNTLIGPLGTPTLATDTTALFTAGQTANASIRVAGGSTSQAAFSFATDGSANPWDMRWVYDPQLQILGWQDYGGPIRGYFDTSGMNVTGSVTAGTFSGNLNADDLTSGTVPLARLGDNSPAAGLYLDGTNNWSMPASGGGGGINTTTTATFVVVAVNSSQTVSVDDATGIVVGTYLQISDGPHTIAGHVTAIASLDLTVVTTAIVLGLAGDTMGSGAAVQSGTFPGSNTVNLSDLAWPATPTSLIHFMGSEADETSSGAGTVKLRVGTETGQSVFGYVVKETLDFNAFQANVLPGVVGIATATDVSSLITTATPDQMLMSYSAAPNLRFSSLTIGAIPNGLITPAKLNCTNALTDAYVFTYDSASGHFKMAAQATGVPGSGTTAGFLRGDDTWSNTLGGGQFILGADTPPVNGSSGLVFQTAGSLPATSGEIYPATFDGASTWTAVGTPNWLWIDAPLHVATSGYPVSAIDGLNGQTESAFGMNLRAVGSIRGNSGFWDKMRYVTNPTGTQTIDPSTNPYVRFESINSNFTIALADNSSVPATAGVAYASEVTLEFDPIGVAYTVTWPGTITWLDGASAPQPSQTSGQVTIIKLIRAQDVGDGHGAKWFGYRLFAAVTAGTGTVTTVATGSGLTGGPITTTGTISIAASGVTSSMIQSGAVGNTQLASGIQPSKLQGYPSDSSKFLNGAGGWTVPTSTGTGWPVFNVKSSGAVGNGTTDDTTAIQNAINAAISNGGGTVYFPAGTYKISSSLTMSIGINLLGEGSTRTRGTGGGSRAASSVIKWSSTAGAGTMVSLTGNVGGMQWSGLQFDGNSVAAKGWYFESVFASCFQHCAIMNCITYGIQIYPQAASDGFTNNLLSNLDIECGILGATAIKEDAANHDTNMCHNVFQNLFLTHGNRALDLGWCDNNDFIQTFCYTSLTSNADVLLRGGGTTISGDNCDTVRFYHLEGEIEVEDGVTACSVYGYDQSNAQADPVITGDGELLLIGGPAMQITSAPTTGATVALHPSGETTTVIIPPAGTLANLTVTLSKGSMKGQRVQILVTQAITTFSGPGDGTYVALPTTLSAGQKITYVWYGLEGSGTWYYIGA